MLHYLCLYWDPLNKEAEARATAARQLLSPSNAGWLTTLSGKGVLIGHRRDTGSAVSDLQLSDGQGVVFGTLFQSAKHSNGNTGKVAVFDRGESNRIVETDGRALIQDYWGRYVGFVFDSRESRLCVVRDPAEGLPCFYTQYNGVTAVFSDLADAIRIGISLRSVNWSYLHAHLRWNRLHSRETGFEGVFALQGGECLTCSNAGVERSFYWAPHAFCLSTQYDDVETASHALRSAVHYCGQAWASAYDKSVELLSGGLDSAILLAALRRNCDAFSVTCINLVTPGADGDERAYAKKAASLWECKIVEQHLDPSDVCLADSVEIPPIPIPSYYPLFFRMDEAMAQVAEEQGAQAILSGRAGDQLFYKSNTPLSVADYAQRYRGLGDTIQIAKDRAIVIGSTIPALLADAWKYGIRHERYDPYANHFQYPPFLNDKILQPIDMDRYSHPWLKGRFDVPPGKLDHIYAVIDGLIFNYDPLGSSQCFDVVNPLISQPVIEICLEIPSYILAFGRKDRGLARHAFVEDVPPEILTRRTKGGTSRYFSEVIEHNREFLCEFVLDGELARQELIIPELLEPFLTGAEPFPIDYCFPFMSCISVEAWLRSFDKVGARSTA